MSQCNVELVIGRLVTDEAFFRRFAAGPPAALDELARSGLRLNPCERDALSVIDLEAVSRFAQCLDPRIQKCDLRAACAPAARGSAHRPSASAPGDRVR